MKLAFNSDALMVHTVEIHTAVAYNPDNNELVEFSRLLDVNDKEAVRNLCKNFKDVKHVLANHLRLLVATDGRITNEGKRYLENKGSIPVSFPNGEIGEYTAPSMPPKIIGYNPAFAFNAS